MSSSDSEDDYYGSSVIKFQKLINNYKEDKIETAELLKHLSVQTVLESNGHSAVNTTSFTPVVETEISTNDSLSDISPNNFNVAAVKRSISQQPRGRHSIVKKRNRQRNVEDKQTIYSVGNTEEYQDLSNGVQLFNTKPLLTLAYNDPLDDNEEPVVETKISNNDSLSGDDTLLDQIIALNSVRQTRSQTNKGAISKRRSRGSTQSSGSKNKPKQSNSTKDRNTDISPNNCKASVNRSISQRPRGRHSIDTTCNRGKSQRKTVKDKQIIYSVGNTEEYQDLSNDSVSEDDTLFDQIIAKNLGRQKRSQRNKGAISRSISQQPRGHHSINTEHNHQRNGVNEQIIYSVGNTEEYQDLSSGVLLFNTRPLLTLSDNDPLDENEELSVKVYWRSSEIVKFTIRKYQKLLQIFEFFARKENITTAKILLLYNDMILKPDDTPDKIDYKISKFIEGGIVDSIPIMLDSNKEFGNGMELKFQCQNVKKPFILRVQKEDKLQTAMLKCAEHFEKPFEALKFVFDGDAIQGSMTPEELELEGGECIDVKLVS